MKRSLMMTAAAAAAVAMAAPTPLMAEPNRYRFKEEPDLAAELREVKKALADRDAEIKKWVEGATEQIKSAGLNDDDRDRIKESIEAANTLGAKMTEIEQALVKLRGASPSGKTAAIKSLGVQTLETESVKSWLEGNGPRGQTATFAFKSVTSLTSGEGGFGELVQPDRRAGIMQPAVAPFFIRTIIPVGRTSSNAIEYIRETGFSNNAAPVAEGAEKPESNLTIEKVSTPVRTIAHWIRVSNQILADAPMLESYLNNRMLWGLSYVEEQQILAGDGTGENILGIIPQATAFDNARRKATDTEIDTIRRAMTQVRLAEYRADVIILNPADWENIELQKTTDGAYIWANPAGLQGPTLWGLPVIETTAVEEGEFIVGALRMAAQIWDREEAKIELFREDRDNVIKNLVTIRAEERLALEVTRPEAIIYGTFEETT